MKIYITDNNKLNNIPSLEENGAVKLFNFGGPNDFATRSIWEVQDIDKFDKFCYTHNFHYLIAEEEKLEQYEKMKIEN